MNLSFENKVAFVTGAGSGIGLATAKAFAEAGASVALVDKHEEPVRAAAEDLIAAGHKALAIRCDVTRAEEVKAALNQTISRFGRLDFAFNNAGVEQPVMATADLTEEEWDRVVDINLRAVFLCMKFQIPLLRKQGGGSSSTPPRVPGSKAFGARLPMPPPSTAL